MVWAHYLLRNSLGGTSGVRIHGVRQTAGSNLGCLRQRSSLALRRPLQQLQPQLKLYLPEQISKASPSFVIGVKDTNRYKSTATAITVGKATAIDAMTQEASGAPAAGGVTSGSASNAAANDDAKKSAPAPEKLWIVGRLMEGLDERLGAKQEKIRIHEIGVIERFSSVISVLDGSLEVREDDDFLDWLNCQESQNLAPGHGNTRDADSEGRSGKGDADGGRGSNEARGARKERENVTKLLSNAAARLNELVALREDSLFRDRGELSVATEKQGEGAESEGRGDEAESASTSAVPEELLYQAKLAAHRAFLSQCLSGLSIYLGKEQLKAGLTVEEVANFARSAYLAGPQDRLGAIFPLFDIHRDGHLDADSVERAVDVMVNSMVLATERCYAAAARSALDKKALKAMPATMKYVLWDVLEVPVKRRCAFAWADGRKQVGPDEWRVSWEQFAPSRIQNFPELESITAKYMAEYSKRRSEWHNRRKARKSSVVYGSALFFAVIFADHLSTLV